MENLFNRYSLNSIVTEGSGVDRFITYMEKEDGTPLTEQEMDSVLDDYKLHQDLMASKFLM